MYFEPYHFGSILGPNIYGNTHIKKGSYKAHGFWAAPPRLKVYIGGTIIPRGSRYPILKGSGPKYHLGYGF